MTLLLRLKRYISDIRGGSCQRTIAALQVAIREANAARQNALWNSAWLVSGADRDAIEQSIDDTNTTAHIIDAALSGVALQTIQVLIRNSDAYQIPLCEDTVRAWVESIQKPECPPCPPDRTKRREMMRHRDEIVRIKREIARLISPDDRDPPPSS